MGDMEQYELDCLAEEAKGWKAELEIMNAAWEADRDEEMCAAWLAALKGELTDGLPPF